MKMSYALIKEAAEKAGVKVTDLLALAPQNDPFYAGTPTDVIQARWFADIWQRAGYTSGVHLRRVHYWVVSQNPPVLMPNGMAYEMAYENTDKCWKFLGQASKMARYLGLVRIEDIADNKNPTPHVAALYVDIDPSFQIYSPDLAAPHIWINGIENTNAQPYHLEVWCEKSTMNDVLLPVCRRYNANLVTFEGEVSITSCYEFIRRIQGSGGKPTRVWYISDFDPAGNSMPVAMSRKVEFMLHRYGCDFDVRIKPLALTSDQVEQYRLPRIPIKETEKRAARFEDAFGKGAVELDALEALYPGTLADELENSIEDYYSQEAAEEVERQQLALRQSINTQIEAIAARYQAHIEALKAMQAEISAIDVEPDEYAVERYQAQVNEDDGWLFDSQRNYVEQIVRYKAHKGVDSIVA